MIELGNHKIYIGDFHTHWYWDKENPTLLISGMQYLGADFILLCYHENFKEIEQINEFCKRYKIPFKAFPGREIAYKDAHIVCWVDKNFTPKNYPELNGLKSNLSKLKQNAKLVIFAHPSKNWVGAYNKNYQPLVRFYKENLIDAIQVQSSEPYQVFTKENLKIPVLGGFDIHACASFREPPKFLFNKTFPTFKHIIPCSTYLTLVFTSELDEENILQAVKSGKTVIFNVNKKEFIGPKDLIEILVKEKFYEKWKKQQEIYNKFKINTNFLVSEKSFVKVSPEKKAKFLIYPHKSLMHPKQTNHKFVRIKKLPFFLKRDCFYSPVTVGTQHRNILYGILTEQPISFETFTRVKNNIPEVEIKLLNKTSEVKKINLTMKFPKQNKQSLSGFQISPKKCKILYVQVPQINYFGKNYNADLSLSTKNFKLTKDKNLSFPICKYVSKSNQLWKINSKDAIHIEDTYIFNRENWRGKNDLSGEICLKWNEKYFYLYAEVKDDMFYHEWTGWETFWGDCLQFAFGPFLDKTEGYGKNYEFTLALTSNGEEVFMWNSPYYGTQQVRKLCKDADLKINRDERKKITYYKLQMPWKILKPFSPNEGKRFLFSMVIIDNDGNIPDRKWFYYGENIAVRKSMAGSHTVTLI